MPALRVNGIGRTIRKGDGELAVLQGLDLVVDPGEIVGVTGPLDSGWRSLLRLIVGLDPVTEGAVELEGAPRERPELRQHVVLASALDPLLDRGPAGIAGIFRLAASRARRVSPAAWDAIVAAAGVASSAGPWTRCERLQLCVSLALTLSPAHVLLEVEPPIETAGGRRALGGLLQRVAAEGRGVVLATRDELLLAEVATRVLILVDGEVLAEGTPESVLTAAWLKSRAGGGA